MPDVNEGSNRSTEGGADRQIPLPWVARFILFVLVLLLASFMIGLPVWSVQRYGATTGIDLWGPVVATLLGLTTMMLNTTVKTLAACATPGNPVRIRGSPQTGVGRFGA